MIPLRPIILEDRAWMAPRFEKSAFLGCEQSFGCNYLWRSVYDVRVADMEGFNVVATSYDGQQSFLFPAGEGDVKTVLDAMLDHQREQGSAYVFNSVDSEQREVLERLYPGTFDYVEKRSSFDYLYASQDLISLAGKKYHAKRGHVAAFKRDYDWTFEMLDENNVEECLSMNEEWCRRNGCFENESLAAESRTVGNALRSLTEIGLFGGLIRVGGYGIAAFSIGERVSDRVCVVHAEKAFTEVKGAYSIINQQFAEHFGTDVQYLNREDDAGSEGLRKAKLSYHPAILLPKYQVKLK